MYLFQNTEYLNVGNSFFKIFPNKLDSENLFSKKVIIPTKKNYEFKVLRDEPSGKIFHDLVLMTFLIASIWIVPGFVFTRMTNQKFKRRELARQAKRVSKLYPSS